MPSPANSMNTILQAHSIVYRGSKEIETIYRSHQDLLLQKSAESILGLPVTLPSKNLPPQIAVRRAPPLPHRSSSCLHPAYSRGVSGISETPLEYFPCSCPGSRFPTGRQNALQ